VAISLDFKETLIPALNKKLSSNPRFRKYTLNPDYARITPPFPALMVAISFSLDLELFYLNKPIILDTKAPLKKLI